MLRTVLCFVLAGNLLSLAYLANRERLDAQVKASRTEVVTFYNFGEADALVIEAEHPVRVSLQ